MTNKKDTRLFARFDLDYADHPKIGALSDAAFRAHVELILYSRKYLTDGRIPARVVNRLGSGVVSELLSNDPVSPSLVDNGDGSYQLHGYADMNETREDVEERKRRNSANGSRGGRPRKTDSVSESLTESGTQNKAETETETETTTPKGVVKRPRRNPEVPLPDDWTPNQTHVRIAVECGVDGRREEAQFRDHAAANDRRQRDWDAAFRTWLRNARPSKLTPTQKATRTVMLATDLLEVEA